MDKFDKYNNDIFKIIFDNLEQYNKKYIIRNRKFNFIKLFSFLIYLIVGDNLSYTSLTSQILFEHDIDLSKSAINKKRLKFNLSCIDKINNDLTVYINDKLKLTPHHNNLSPDRGFGRMIAVDGSKLILDQKFSQSGYKSINDRYCHALLSGLFDIENNISIDYSLFNHSDERNALISQLDKVNQNDALCMDGGYYSDPFIKKLIDLNIHFIFRIKHNLKIIRNQFKKNNNCCYIYHNNLKLKVIRYYVGKIRYFILTDLINHKNDKLKEYYKNRWKIETQFRYATTT